MASSVTRTRMHRVPSCVNQEMVKIRCKKLRCIREGVMKKAAVLVDFVQMRIDQHVIHVVIDRLVSS